MSREERIKKLTQLLSEAEDLQQEIYSFRERFNEVISAKDAETNSDYYGASLITDELRKVEASLGLIVETLDEASVDVAEDCDDDDDEPQGEEE